VAVSLQRRVPVVRLAQVFRLVLAGKILFVHWNIEGPASFGDRRVIILVGRRRRRSGKSSGNLEDVTVVVIVVAVDVDVVVGRPLTLSVVRRLSLLFGVAVAVDNLLSTP
jgi:hypothetical protein